MVKKKYFTEEERKEAKKAYDRKYQAKYYQEHKAEIIEKTAKYRKDHKDEIAERKAEYYQNHKAEIAEYNAKYNQEHKDEKAEYDAKRYSTKEGRASNLIRKHKLEDKKRGRGDIDLTVPWFVRNIYTKCIYCGETDWKKLGCDRIDNSLPHTMENVVPCCVDCNKKRGLKQFEQFYLEMKHKKMLEGITTS